MENLLFVLKSLTEIALEVYKEDLVRYLKKKRKKHTITMFILMLKLAYFLTNYLLM